MEPAPLRPFSELSILDRSRSVAGAYCAKLFADLGARVRATGSDHLGEAQRLYLRPLVEPATNDPADGDGVDVVLDGDDGRPAAWAGGSDGRPAVGPEVVAVGFSHHGPVGPYAHWHGTDLTDYALGGHLHLTGHPDRAPLQGPAHQPAIAAGLFGFVGAMAALWTRTRTGQGQRVEVDHVRTLVALHQFTLLRYTLAGDVLGRMGNRFAGQGQPNGLYPCADGWVAISAPAEQQVESILDATGLAGLLDHPLIDSPLDFQIHPRLLDDALQPWLAARTVAEVVELFQAMRVPAAPAPTMSGLLEDPHLAQRGAWDHAGGLRRPRSPFRFSPARPAGPGAGAGADRGRRWTPGPIEDGPLAGLKVLDLTRVWAGPLCTRILADLGADVVWVEAPWARGPRRLPQSQVEATRYFPNDDQGDDQWNRNGHLIKYALGKRSLVIDLEEEAGRELLAELVPGYDVLIENYSPRVMPNLGFDQDRLHQLNPDLIYVTMPGYGRSGPAMDWLAYGTTVDSHAGLSSLIGYPDAAPWKAGLAWPDPIAGLHATAGILKALWDREAEVERGGGGRGRGRALELAQFEATLAVVGDRLIEAQLGGDPDPPGNRHPHHRFQGVYPCAGDDRWVAISVVDDERWRALVEVAGLDPRLDPAPDHDRLDVDLAAWTAGLDHHEVATRLQAVGVAAAPVLDAAGLMANPHLRANGTFVHLDQPGVGPFTTPAIPIDLPATPARVRGPAPDLGEHNREILDAELTIDPHRYQSLVEAGVVADQPPA